MNGHMEWSLAHVTDAVWVGARREKYFCICCVIAPCHDMQGRISSAASGVYANEPVWTEMFRMEVAFMQ